MKSLTAASHSPDTEEEGIQYMTHFSKFFSPHNYAVFASDIQYHKGTYSPKPPLNIRKRH
jgi:hypothetical protein